jgi:hypothetical protein
LTVLFWTIRRHRIRASHPSDNPISITSMPRRPLTRPTKKKHCDNLFTCILALFIIIQVILVYLYLCHFIFYFNVFESLPIAGPLPVFGKMLPHRTPRLVGTNLPAASPTLVHPCLFSSAVRAGPPFPAQLLWDDRDVVHRRFRQHHLLETGHRSRLRQLLHVGEAFAQALLQSLHLQLHQRARVREQRSRQAQRQRTGTLRLRGESGQSQRAVQREPSDLSGATRPQVHASHVQRPQTERQTGGSQHSTVCKYSASRPSRC